MQTDDGEEIVEGAQEQDEAEELNLIPVQLDEEHETTYETIHLTTNSGNSSNNVRGKYYKQTYRQAWEHMPDFKGLCCTLTIIILRVDLMLAEYYNRMVACCYWWTDSSLLHVLSEDVARAPSQPAQAHLHVAAPESGTNSQRSKGMIYFIFFSSMLLWWS